MIQKKRILFVDDEPNFLDGLRRMLRDQRETWDMHFAHSVDEAMDKTRETDFDSIVADVRMPVKDGFDLLEELRDCERTKTVPVIVLTGNAEADLKRRALDLGATDLLNKPVVSEDLLARLRSVLRLKWHQDQLKAQNEILDQKVRERTLDLERSRRDIIWRLAKAGEFRDEETGDHVIRVACCSRVLAKAVGLDANVVETIFLTSPLHDIGKIGVPDGVLLKKGKLTSTERKVMEEHCEIGASVLLEEPKGMGAFLEDPEYRGDRDTPATVEPLREAAASIAVSHHEKWDGSGYPKGLAGEAIPIPGRIVAVTDVYDALRSKRPYKPQFSVEKSLAIMREGAGSHFAPDTHEAFETVTGEFEEIRHRYSS